MKKIYSSLFISFCFVVQAQQSLPDSLNKIALKVSRDSAAKLYVALARHFIAISPDSVIYFADKALRTAPKNSIAIGDAYIQKGNYSHMTGKVDSALYYYTKAQTFFKSINHEKGIGKVYQSFGVVKNSMKDYQGALEDNKKAIEIYERIGFKKGLTMVYMGCGNLFNRLNKKEAALNYMRLAMNNALSLGDSSWYYQTMAEFGALLIAYNRPDSSNYYYKKSIPYLEKNGFNNSLIVAYSNYAEVLFQQKPRNIPVLKEFLFKSLNLCKQLNIRDNLQSIYRQIAGYYVLCSKPDSVQYYMSLSALIADTLCNAQNMSLLHETETKYETEKKDLQIKNQSLEIDVKQKENDAKNKILLLGTFGLLGVLIFAFIAYKNFIKTKKANIIINNQKQQVELQKEEISNQKILVEEKQKEIIDSINYAQKIQSAILTGEEVWKKISNEYFIIFQPKDIVSGDFYWAFNTMNNRSVIVLADCTGHGVPGGFMSMLGNSLLNEIVVENKMFKPDQILNKLRQKIISSLGQKGSADRRDGMDMAVCTWNKLDNSLEFSGANNRLWIIRNGSLTEYSGDKMPVGNFEGNATPFNCQTVQLEKNDLIVMSTDGFSDQFGGDGGKKFMSKNLKNLLLNNSDLPLEAQKRELANAFNSWKGNQEQVDDISLIMIKVL